MRERERSLPPLCNRRRVWRRRGREVVASAFPRLCISSRIVILFTACGLSWFLIPLWVFHVTSCVSTLFQFSALISCKHSLFGCGQANLGDPFLTKWYHSVGLEEEMDDSLGGMFKLTGSNYSVWKSKMRETGQDRCHGLGSNAHEDNNIHSVIHRHEPVQQVTLGGTAPTTHT